MLSDLAWLPLAPADFRAELSALKSGVAAGDSASLQRLLSLSLSRLDDSQLNKLANISRQIPDANPFFSPVKLGLLGDGTLSLLGTAIAGSAVRHGLRVEVVEGSYGAAVSDATDTGSHLHGARLDMALLALDYRLAGLDTPKLSEAEAAQAVEDALGRIRLIVSGLRPGLTGPMLVQTLPTPVEPLFGSFDRIHPGSVYAMVEALNARLVEWARKGDIVLVDIARLAASIGSERWHDAGHWHASKLAFAPEFIPAYGDMVARVIAAVKGKTKKALVLDLDNTLWGGIIGDDGLDGIALGQGNATGEAFIAIQRLALDLRARGIVLAVCSKNEEAAARSPFQSHPEMLLKESDIAVFQANWTDKASNLRAIAETLNIGVDALVFLDDNPAERAQVRAELPLVGVPELPADPALYPRMLASAGYFETIALSDEDRARADQYQANAARAQLLTAASDMEGYLRSLAMTCSIQPVTATGRARVAQLINKSNQFNLTTRRYTEPEVEALSADPSKHIVQIRLVDRFGDNGIISVLVADKRGTDWEIDTWLMSCRVLGRRVEQAALQHLAAAARGAGASRLIGRYIPSAKNMMVEQHYQKLGFEKIEQTPEGVTVWELRLDGWSLDELPMTIVDEALQDEVA